MKWVILTEGGRDLGFGHVTRCLAFYEGLKKRGFRVTLIVNGDDSLRDLLHRKGHRIFNWLNRRKELPTIIEGAEVALVDSYWADRKLYERVSRYVRCGVYFDDTRRLDYPEGIVINGALGAEGLRYPKKEGVTYLLGIKYTPLRKAFAKIPQKRIRRNVRTMMITFGGDDRGFTPRLVDYLNKTYPRIRKEVVVARGFENVSEIGKLEGRLTIPIYFPNAQGMKELMLKADLAISGGGQTLYELARVGVPSIAIGLSENQLTNIKGWQKVGFLSYAGSYRDGALLDRLKREVDRLLPYEVRLKRSEAGRTTMDGKGVERAIDRILDFLNGRKNICLRRATETDCYDVWNWRNHPEVRRWSFDKGEIDYSYHVEWFKEKLGNKDSRIYIAENERGQKLGQVRFERKKADLAVVNINVNPDFLRKGLGNRILSKATLQYLRDNREVKEVRAEILEGNSASRKAFQKAGYRFSHAAFKAGRSVALYKYARS